MAEEKISPSPEDGSNKPATIENESVSETNSRLLLTLSSILV